MTTSTVPAVEATITARVASFRDPLYAAAQIGLPCPPPSTVGGALAAAVGGWAQMPVHTRFAMAFTTAGQGVDLETYHPLDAHGRRTTPTPKERGFLFDVVLTVWLLDDLALWRAALRRPVWPLRLGRSQDLADARTRMVTLHPGPGRQQHAIVPAEVSTAGSLLRLPATISIDRDRHTWNSYRYDPTGRANTVPSDWTTDDGQAIVPLHRVHPDTIATPGAAL
ncbi:CRISPR-associated protein Cas5 [Amycolatopsis anabasis]|uniref:CRISPR-associated protein Cas5 n=1 Tax=Amycolatopsis anabasis TaxID=1840409 RepID=UPI00131B839D|nr:CRISPR-associated protein Cas5 [Amycolatopsis anabasis]